MHAAPEQAPRTVVMKFGGSSVADPDKIRHVARRLVEAHEGGARVVGTVSAMGKTTDALLELAHQVSPHPHPRELDMLLSTGERTACALVAMAVHDLGHEAVSFTGSQAGILTDAVHTRAKIRQITPVRILEGLDAGKIVLVAGFQGFSRDTMDITTLGRGAGDLTAVALAAVLGASCEIFSDVLGVYTADPRIVPDARKLDTVSYEEMLEMAASGARVLALRSVELGRGHGVPIHARSTFSEEQGTWIGDVAGMEEPIVSAVTHSEDEVLFTLRGRARRSRHGGRDLRGRLGRARQRRHHPPERRPRFGGALVLGPAGGRERHASCAGGGAEDDRRDRGRGDLRPRQGVARRSGDAVAPGRRSADVPDARGRVDQPATDLDLADQDLVPRVPRRGGAGRARAPLGVPRRARRPRVVTESASVAAVEAPSRARSLGAYALVVVAGILLFLTTFAVWVDRVALNTAVFADTSSELIEDDAIRRAVATRAVDELYESVDVEAELEGPLPEDVESLAGPTSAALRQVAPGIVERALQQPRLQRLWREAVATSHATLVEVLEERSGTVSTEEGVVTLDLGDIVREAADRIGVSDAVEERIDEDAGRIELLRSDDLDTAQDAFQLLNALAWLLPLLTLGAFALALWLAGARRRPTVRAIGVAILVCGLVGLLAVRVIGLVPRGRAHRRSREPRSGRQEPGRFSRSSSGARSACRSSSDFSSSSPRGSPGRGLEPSHYAAGSRPTSASGATHTAFSVSPCWSCS